MRGMTSVFEILSLLDMICNELKPQDIRNCASCNKDWFSFFSPYRFKFVQFSNSSQERTLFLLENSHHIRELELNLTNAEAFVNPQCTRLKKLTLEFAYEDEEELNDAYPDDLEQEELNTIEGTDSPVTKLDKSMYAAELIQMNQGLRTLRIDSDRRITKPLRPLTKSILKAIANHPCLTTIQISMSLPCFVLLKVLRQLPRQLQELDIYVNSDLHQDEQQDDHQYHMHCNKYAGLFKSSGTVFNLRRLILNTNLNCFHHRMLIPLLRQCPDLEELMLPDINEHIIIELAQVLDSHCKRLHTLFNEHYDGTLSPAHVNTLLRTFTRGFRQLCLHGTRRYSEGSLLETLITTATVNTIEVLRICSHYLAENRILGFLRHCPRLREFHTGDESSHYFGIDVSDLVVSMDEGWKCWDTLEVLTLETHNRKAAIEHSCSKERHHNTALDARKLCLGLRTLPKLVTLDIHWMTLSAREGCFEGSGKILEREIFEIGTEVEWMGGMLSTEDMEWIGILRP